MIHIPGGSDPAYVEYGCAVNVSVAGGGLVALELWDVTAGGTGTILHAASRGFLPTQVALYAGLANTIRGRHRLDVASADRILQLKALLYRDGGSSLAATVANTARGGAGGGQPTYLGALTA
jgi:hypothetical protein